MLIEVILHKKPRNPLPGQRGCPGEREGRTGGGKPKNWERVRKEGEREGFHSIHLADII